MEANDIPEDVEIAEIAKAIGKSTRVTRDRMKRRGITFTMDTTRLHVRMDDLAVEFHHYWERVKQAYAKKIAPISFSKRRKVTQETCVLASKGMGAKLTRNARVPPTGPLPEVPS